jgi:hypothetical protein
LKSDGEIECWGANEDVHGTDGGQSTPPDGVFGLVVASFNTSCALNKSGLPVCWGDNSDTVFSPPTSTFGTMGIGYLAACGLTQGDLECWGDKGIVDAAP